MGPSCPLPGAQWGSAFLGRPGLTVGLGTWASSWLPLISMELDRCSQSFPCSSCDMGGITPSYLGAFENWGQWVDRGRHSTGHGAHGREITAIMTLQAG